ncbi:MAG: hypothetical protein KDC98_23865 [Planctomycetes bacterium]|nr:hypothetical protein [Planctomycetota bacterium]
MSDRRTLVALAAALSTMLVSACQATPLPRVDADWAMAAADLGVTLDELERGRALLATDCAACHIAVHPSELTLEDWDEVLPRMLQKAQLEARHGQAIRAYVVTASNRAR